EILFRPCADYLGLGVGPEKPVPDTDLADYPVVLGSSVREALTQASLTVTTLHPDGRPAGFRTVVAMDRLDLATFRATVRVPRAACDGLRLAFTAEVTGQSGRIYKDDGACARLVRVVPQCPCGVTVRQELGFCQARPDAVALRYSAESTIEGSVV